MRIIFAKQCQGLDFLDAFPQHFLVVSSGIKPRIYIETDARRWTIHSAWDGDPFSTQSEYQFKMGHDRATTFGSRFCRLVVICGQVSSDSTLHFRDFGLVCEVTAKKEKKRQQRKEPAQTTLTRDDPYPGKPAEGY
jgi:hypothetical protein